MDRTDRRKLDRVEMGLPSQFYFDPDHHRRELEAIWYESWLYVCRAEDLARSRDYRVFQVGDQSVIVTRDLEGRLHAFHNTCRHRGSILCTEEQGRFKGAAITCPYHGWTYSLDGELQATPNRLDSAGFRKQDYSLYAVAVEEWAGYVFINLLGERAPSLASFLGEVPSRLSNWHIEDLRVGYRSTLELACNWKIFWENFNECLHCPGIHPELSKIVPIYGKGLVSERELPESDQTSAADAGAPEAPLAPGSITWTLDGQTEIPHFANLSDEERRQGQTFGTAEPSFYTVAHVDYVRAARIRPLGPEKTEVAMEWLFDPSVLKRDDFDLEHATALGRRVIEQDGHACELNQRGLRSKRHESGVLVSQEYWVYRFQQWVLECLGEGERPSLISSKR